MKKTIFDTVRNATRGSQPLENCDLAERLDNLKVRKLLQNSEVRNQERIELLNVEKRANADSGTIPDDEEDFSSLFGD